MPHGHTPRSLADPGPADAHVLASVGALLLDAGLSVTDVRTGLIAAGTTASAERLSFSVLPSLILVGQRDRGDAAVVREAVPDSLSTRQAARSLLLLRGIESGAVHLRAVPDAIEAVRAAAPRHPASAWVLGSALVSVGLAVLFRCPWWAVATAAIGGALVGALTRAMSRVSTAAALVPFAAAFASTLLVGACAAWLGAGPVPLFAVCAPIAILVPGALITNALLELTATDIVTGSARLAYGMVVLGFMAAGIAAGAALTGLHVDPDSAALVGQPIPSAITAGAMAIPATWVAWIGVVALAVGVGIALGAGIVLSLIGVAVMLGTYATLGALTPLWGSTVATGVTATALFVAARLVERLGAGIPASTTFQPAFLLLVPGSVGLVALSTGETGSISAALLSFAALCIGSKFGSFLSDLPVPARRHRPGPAPDPLMSPSPPQKEPRS